MADRTTGSQSKTKALTWCLQDSVGNHLRSVYQIDRHVPERIFRLLQQFEEQSRRPALKGINPAPRDPKVDRTSDDGRTEPCARHDRSNDAEGEAKRERN
jgi:hypothetical protein